MRNIVAYFRNALVLQYLVVPLEPISSVAQATTSKRVTGKIHFIEEIYELCFSFGFDDLSVLNFFKQQQKSIF